MRKWPTIRIADEFSLQMGKTPARDNPAYWRGDKNWAAISDIARSGMYLTKTKETISQTAVDESGIKVVPPDTIVMSFKLSIGRTAITTSRIYTNEAIMAFLPHDASAFDLHFLYHLFSNRDWSEGSNKAVKGMTLNKATLNAAKIPKPDISEQRTIANILDKLCDLVEKCDEQLERLDQLVKSRFVEMFGDLVANDKRWTFAPLGKVCDVRDGTHASPQYLSAGYPLMTSKNFTGGYEDFSDVKFISKEDFDEINKRSRVDVGDIVMPMIGTIGNPVIITSDREFAIKNVSLIKFIDGSPINVFVKAVLSSQYFQRAVDEKNRGNTQKFIALSDIRGFRIPLPPIALQREFAAFVAKADKLAFAARRRRDLAQQMYRAKIQEFFG